MTHPPQPVVVFLHIQKNAGSTLHHVLLRNYGPGFAWRMLRRLRHGRPTNVGIPEAIRTVPASERFIAGHFSFGVHELIARPAKYLCLLRDPVRRLVSLYNYSASTPGAYYHEQAVGRSAREFLLETDLMELDNGQVRFLAGGSDDLFINRTPLGQCGAALLAHAKANVRDHFYSLGLVERFDESLLLFKRELGWRDCFYVSRNVRRVGTPAPDLDDRLLAEVAARNQLDIELYEWARQQFELRVAEIDPPMVEQLAGFRASNRRFSATRRPFIRAYDSAKKLLGL